jgi:hypothetical protein
MTTIKPVPEKKITARDHPLCSAAITSAIAP